MALSILLVVAACGSTDDRAEADTRRLVSERLDAIEEQLSASLPSFDPIADASRVSTWVPATYFHSIEGNTLTLEFGVRAVGRDGATVGENVVAGGACVRVIGDQSGGTIQQVDCPQSFLRERGRSIDLEVEVVDSERPLKAKDD